jgi:hypothetical protein
MEFAKEIAFTEEETALFCAGFDDPLEESKEQAAARYGVEPADVDVFWSTPERKTITALVYL